MGALCAALWLAASPAAGDVVRLLDGDAESLQARFALIDGAQRSIQMAYYWVDGDAVSCSIFACLRDARRRGVSVQLLVDAHRNRIPPPMSNYLLGEGVEIRQYHPLRWLRLPEYMQRLHDKLLVADGEAMIVGGRNVSSKYFGQADGENFRDRDILVIGSAAREASAYFHGVWRSEEAAPVAFRAFPAETPPYGFPTLGRRRWIEETIAARQSEANAGALLDQAQPGRASPQTFFSSAGASAPTARIPPPAVRFLHSSRVVQDPGGDITDDLLSLIGAAKRRIDIESAYLVLTDRFFAALAAAAARGVPVSILTNSLATTNQVLAQAGYVNQRKKLLDAGIQLWEYHGEGQLHAKCLAIDDWAVVGSYNLHPRSDNFDTEVAVVVQDAWLAAQLRGLMDQRRAESSPAGGDPAPPAAAAAPLRQASASRRALLPLLRLAARLLKPQL